MSDNKPIYEAYAHEIADLYNSFRRAGFDYDEAFELTKICILNPHNNNNFYAQLEMKRRNDDLKAALANLNRCKGEEKNHD